MEASITLNRRLLYFTLVGALSTLVHVALVLAIVHYLAQLPLVANAVAFPTAFIVSYLGHKQFTFSKMQAGKKLRLGHFLVIAVVTGVMNEALYGLFLKYYFVELSFCFGYCDWSYGVDNLCEFASVGLSVGVVSNFIRCVCSKRSALGLF